MKQKLINTTNKSSMPVAKYVKQLFTDDIINYKL